VDECDEHQYENPCHGICTNTNGGYNCSPCPEGSFGDGRKDGNGCSIIDKNKLPVTVPEDAFPVIRVAL
ncbi:hypothetical protein MKX03_020334, partial [Papaver bracteatum]